MRFPILMLILIATLFGGNFWYQYVDTTCKIPTRYRIGNIDSRFNTSEEEVRRITARAEALWEDSLHTDIFMYDQSSDDVVIHFVYDDRQEEAIHEAEIRADLEKKEHVNESVAHQYETLRTEFEVLEREYESRVSRYEETLRIYNEEVASWNAKGGAPEDIIETLRSRSLSLAREQETLTERAETLNMMVKKLNQIGAKGNQLTNEYNTTVNVYNSEFTEAREFAQGDYKQKVITIYQFDSEEELTLVLAHELGHALSLDHVPNERSIMHYLMESQTTASGIQPEDRTEFNRVCTEKSFWKWIRTGVSNS